MTDSSFYHPTREAAQVVLTRLLEDPRVATGALQLEPYNGWVVVLVPAPADISDLAHLAEIQDGKKRPPPVDQVKPAKVSAPAAARGDGGGAAPVKGATAMVWTIADKVVKELGRVDRSSIINACVAQGINQATAGTQYSKWKKARGL